MNKRPPVPPDVRLQLRRESLFGCCRCGFPIFQFHHIVPYEVDPHFRPEDMMVLCPNCHDMATKKALRECDQRRFKAMPFNRKHGYAQGKLVAQNGLCQIMLGQNTFNGTGCFIRVDESCLVRLDVGVEGDILISTSLYSRSDDLLVVIEQNEWLTGNPTPWDLESGYQYLKIRSKPHEVLLELKASKQPMSLQAKLWRRGVQIDARPRQILINGGPVRGMTMTGNTLDNWCVGISSHSGAGGIIPMKLHPNDLLFGPSQKA